MKTMLAVVLTVIAVALGSQLSLAGDLVAEDAATEGEAAKTDAAKTETTVMEPATEAGDGLDLNAVAELLAESESLEEFEESLNDTATGVNNLDLDADGTIDYIRVEEDVEDDMHVAVLQVELAEDDFQDVATIQAERVEDTEDEVNVQVQGDTEIYGEEYYVAPTVTVVHVTTMPILRLMFGPRYAPWRSPWRWGRYPKSWSPRPVLTVAVYRSRAGRWTRRGRFGPTRTSRVRRAHRMYKPKSSKRAVKNTKPAKATTPGKTTPGKTTPGKTTPGKTTPGKTTPGKTPSAGTGSKSGSKTQQSQGSKSGGKSGTGTQPSGGSKSGGKGGK